MCGSATVQLPPLVTLEPVPNRGHLPQSDSDGLPWSGAAPGGPRSLGRSSCFKDEVALRQGEARANRCHDVFWAALMPLLRVGR